MGCGIKNQESICCLEDGTFKLHLDRCQGYIYASQVLAQKTFSSCGRVGGCRDAGMQGGRDAVEGGRGGVMQRHKEAGMQVHVARHQAGGSASAEVQKRKNRDCEQEGGIVPFGCLRLTNSTDG